MPTSADGLTWLTKHVAEPTDGARLTSVQLPWRVLLAAQTIIKEESSESPRAWQQLPETASMHHKCLNTNVQQQQQGNAPQLARHTVRDPAKEAGFNVALLHGGCQ